MNPRFLRTVQRLTPFSIAAVALLILNGTSWWAYRVSSTELRENFVRNLVTTAEIFARQFENAYWMEFENRLEALERESPASDATDPAILEIDVWLEEKAPVFLSELAPALSERSTFQDVYLLNRRGAVIQTLTGDLIPNRESDFRGDWNIHPALIQEDSIEIRTALEKGTAQTTHEVFQEGAYYQTAYAPIKLDQSPVGLVGVRANLLFGERLTQIRRRIIVADLLGSLMVLFLSLMFSRVSEGLRSTEERLRHQQRLAQLGQMVSIVAHEIRNPLGIIEQTAELVRRRYAKDKKDELLDYIPEEVERLNRIIERFLEFARPERTARETSREQCEISAVLARVHRQLAPQAEQKGLSFSVDTPETGVLSGLGEDSLQQIVLNLLLNAFDATPSGGNVAVKVRRRGGWVVLTVSDTGCGMKPEHVEKATDPFFTTKEKGSGLGLALVAKLIEESGGRMEIRSRPNRGTEITIRLKTFT